jgi:hypothetical protein
MYTMIKMLQVRGAQRNFLELYVVVLREKISVVQRSRRGIFILV